MTLLHAPLEVVENVPLARHTYRIRLHGPDLAAAVRPGQFLMLRLPGTTDPLLGRPFALYDTVLSDAGQPVAVDVVYLVVGKMTGQLAAVRSGQRPSGVGPPGQRFRVAGRGRACGAGCWRHRSDAVPGARAPVARRARLRRSAPRREAQRVSLYYGVRSADLAAGVDDFRAAGAEVHLASDDGSLGEQGFVTQLLERHGPPEHLFGCGPEPMLHALAKLAQRWNVPCAVSLETPMACGVGVCFSCVTRVKTAEGWDYRRACVEGPVFDAACLEW